MLIRQGTGKPVEMTMCTTYTQRDCTPVLEAVREVNLSSVFENTMLLADSALACWKQMDDLREISSIKVSEPLEVMKQ